MMVAVLRSSATLINTAAVMARLLVVCSDVLVAAPLTAPLRLMTVSSMLSGVMSACMYTYEWIMYMYVK